MKKNSSHIKRVNGVQARTIWDVIEGKEDKLWICSRNNGLLEFDTKLNLLTPYNTDNSSIQSNNIRVFQKGMSDHIMYLGTQEGYVIKFNSKTKEFISLEFSDRSTGAIKSLCIHNENLLIGTQKSGIIVYDLLSGEKTEINKSDGLKNNVIYSLLPQNEKFVWISSNLGISQLDMSRLDSQDSKIVRQHFTKDNGLASRFYFKKY